jgi:hypothetical protein
MSKAKRGQLISDLVTCRDLDRDEGRSARWIAALTVLHLTVSPSEYEAIKRDALALQERYDHALNRIPA